MPGTTRSQGRSRRSPGLRGSEREGSRRGDPSFMSTGKKIKTTDIVQWVHLVLGTLCMLEAEGHTVDGSPKTPINI